VNKVQYPADKDVLEVTWFQEMLTQVPKSHSHKEQAEVVSIASLHLQHPGLSNTPFSPDIRLGDSVFIAATSMKFELM
jgi:hypothetical protein